MVLKKFTSKNFGGGGENRKEPKYQVRMSFQVILVI